MGLDLKKESGFAWPLGATSREGGINFALFSQHAEKVSLCLFFPGENAPFAEFPLDREKNRTGWIWHILLKGLPERDIEYGYRLEGAGNSFNPNLILSDPYALGVSSPDKWGDPKQRDPSYLPRGRVLLPREFNWEEDKPPRIPLEEVVIYEMHVRSFTAHTSSQVQHPGTFLGIIEKIPHLKSLGVNAVELMPIFEFNECDLVNRHPVTGEALKNLWGYSTLNFFAPMNRYASQGSWTSAIDDFRTLVKELHKNGIEVYLDVVYNHTAEGDLTRKTYSFRGIDNAVYYLFHPDGSYRNDSGTGNTFNANHPVPMELILASLRYWVSEMHVDGFRFDLASCLTRDNTGIPLANPPLIHAISHDPILAGVKLIAEAWDAGGLYQVGNFPSQGKWAEWNGQFRDSVRRFIKGSDGESGPFTNALCGSPTLYKKWKNPTLSINFVTAHDGFTLRDLVSYQEKHNEENGEGNRDGESHNLSWNCGMEGVTEDPKILALRERQMRNFHCALILSLGTPMLLMGDEYGHTKGGNNNTYCQDNERNWFLWDALEKNSAFFRFFRLVIQLRKENPLLRQNRYLTDADIQWHGMEPLKANWSGENRLIAYTLQNKEKTEGFYIAFNAQTSEALLHLPSPPQNKQWHRIVDTSQPPPLDFVEEAEKKPPLENSYLLKAHSVLIAKAFR